MSRGAAAAVLMSNRNPTLCSPKSLCRKAKSYSVIAETAETLPSLFYLRLPCFVFNTLTYLGLDFSNSEKAESRLWYFVFSTKHKIGICHLLAQCFYRQLTETQSSEAPSTRQEASPHRACAGARSWRRLRPCGP